MDYFDRYLLIVSCSQSKRSELELLPAIERYDGPMFRVVRRYLRSRSLPVPLDIYILSAEFGLIPSDRPIPNYDRRMTKERSSQLRSSVIEKLIEIFKTNYYREMFICAGKDYLRSLNGYEKFVQPETIIKIAPGGIGTKSSKLKEWLYNRLSQESSNLSTAISPNNENMQENQINSDRQQPDLSKITEESVARDLQNQPHVILKLQENALTIAENLRDNYFKNTAKFISLLRRAMIEATQGDRDNILKVETVKNADWSKLKGEVVTFIDGGLGQVQMSDRVPILLRVGSYRVKTGEHNLEEREQFGYYPVIFGDIEGGSKERKDFPDIVRITAELLGGLSALERTKDLGVLMFHGPLMYLMSAYAGHTPFTEKDIDLFLKQYGGDSKSVEKLKNDFFQEAKLDIYPQMSQRSDDWIEKRLFEPLAWIAFLYRRLIREAKKRHPKPIIVGVVERSYLREFSETILLERIFRGLRKKENQNYFNELYGRSDLNNPKAFLDGLGYTDTLLLSMLLESGRFSESWIINKCGNLGKGQMSLPGESFSGEVNWGVLKSNNNIGFPKIRGFYLKVSETTEPLRIEVFEELYAGQIQEVVKRVYLYAKLLPGYGFPIGLDIVDKYAHIPNWLTNAYEKLIKYHLSISLQTGDITDEQMRRIIVQSIYMTKRDWLFRPKI